MAVSSPKRNYYQRERTNTQSFLFLSSFFWQTLARTLSILMYRSIRGCSCFLFFRWRGSRARCHIIISMYYKYCAIFIGRRSVGAKQKLVVGWKFPQARDTCERRWYWYLISNGLTERAERNNIKKSRIKLESKRDKTSNVFGSNCILPFNSFSVLFCCSVQFYQVGGRKTTGKWRHNCWLTQSMVSLRKGKGGRFGHFLGTGGATN